MTARPELGRLLCHPISLAALAVLVVNDHVLKAWYPGFLTGKLSDLAGMVVAPLVLVAILDVLTPMRWVRRPEYGARSAWACALAVGLVFAATKTWTPATHAYEAAFVLVRAPFRWITACALGREIWNERIVLVRDPTDLVAVPMGALAARIAQIR